MSSEVPSAAFLNCPFQGLAPPVKLMRPWLNFLMTLSHLFPAWSSSTLCRRKSWRFLRRPRCRDTFFLQRRLAGRRQSPQGPEDSHEHQDLISGLLLYSHTAPRGDWQWGSGWGCAQVSQGTDNMHVPGSERDMGWKPWRFRITPGGAALSAPAPWASPEMEGGWARGRAAWPWNLPILCKTSFHH